MHQVGANRPRGRTGIRRNDVRKLLTAWVTLALVFLGFAAGGANDRDETIMTVQVSSADHEVQEGYFTLGDSATVVARPGSDWR